MAVARHMISDVMSLVRQAADPSEPTWGQTLQQGVESFLTVERVRDTVIVVVAAGLYYLLARHAKGHMIMRPTMVVVAQELQAISRAEVEVVELERLIRALEAPPPRSPQEQEALILRGLALRRDLAARARLKELDGVSGDALLSVAAPVKDSLHPPVSKYLTKSSLTHEQTEALRYALGVASAEKADGLWRKTRFALRRIRKSQSLGVAGLSLIVLLVILFGNPAIIAFGVLGAFVSRTIAFFRESTDTDQKYNWVILFLVPIVGGLSAYGGVLLVDAMRTWGLLGDTFAGVEFGGEHANVPTMAAAFLFGFVERLLDNVAGKAADGLGAVTAAEDKSGGTTEKTSSAATATIEISKTDDPDGDGSAGAGAEAEEDKEEPPVKTAHVSEEEPTEPARVKASDETTAHGERPAPAVPTEAPLGTLIETLFDEVMTKLEASMTPDTRRHPGASDAGAASSEPTGAPHVDQDDIPQPDGAEASGEPDPPEDERDPQSSQAEPDHPD